MERCADSLQDRQNPDGSVDVNGDGKSNGVFMGSQNIGLYDSTIQRKRQAANASFQVDLDHGLKLTSDYFYAHQDQCERTVGIQFNSTNWQGATYVPLQSRNTGSTALSQYNTPPQDPDWAGSHIYTTQVYEKWPGDVESYSQVNRWQSTAQNFNVQLDFDNGGPFKGSVRGIRETAKQEYIETDINISDSDGCLWADPNSSLPCGTFVYPTQLGGPRVFNANGIPQNTVPITANFTGPQSSDRHAGIARRRLRQSQRVDHEDAGIQRRLQPQTPRSPRCASMDTTTSTTASTSISACATAFAAPVTTGTRWSPPCTPAWGPATRTAVWCAMSVPM